MSFSPVIPVSGLAGLRYLDRTQAAQRAAFDRSPQIEREVAYFKDRIGRVETAEQLVADRTLLKVALGAFGLEDELSKKFFLKKVLAEGSEDLQSFANRLVDSRYRSLARAFGFGDSGGARTGDEGFGDTIVEAFRTRQFERAVGESDNDLRLALTFRREISGFSRSEFADGSAWFQVMGNTPLRTVIEKAYNLPASIGTLDIDRQREIFKTKTRDLFGSASLAVFEESGNVEKLLQRFFAQAQSATGAQPTTPGYAAITMLQSGSASLANLVRSNFAR